MVLLKSRVALDYDVHASLKRYCAIKRMKLGDVASMVLRAFLETKYEEPESEGIMTIEAKGQEPLIERRKNIVKKATLDRFIRLGGYNIVKLKDGKWKNITLASRRTGISRPTIYAILEKYPQAPSKVMPKYVEEFKDKPEPRRTLKDIEIIKKGDRYVIRKKKRL